MAEKSCSDGECASGSIPSNEEIVDEVLKGLQDNATNSENNGASGESQKSPDKNAHKESVTTKETPFQNNESSDEENEAAKGDGNESDDAIDEVGLKDIEVQLTEIEREKRRSEAEKCKTRGNDNFKGLRFKESIGDYTLGLRTCPLAYPKDRAILYANRAAAMAKLGLSKSAIEDCEKAVDLDPTYLKARLRLSNLYEETEKYEEALEGFKEILKLDYKHAEALAAVDRLPGKINERNEKMKQEMFAKLKDLGNMILRPFNLSTDNFQVNQDSNSGGYSINFKPNS